MKIGEISWGLSDLFNELEEFAELYKKRPIENNAGGMKSPHMFPTWFVAKRMQPEYIIESGVFKGQGTWLFEQASPKSKIISIDINPGQIIYRSDKVEYRDQDMTTYNWDHLNKDNTLVFLDDHQDAFKRSIYLHAQGFKYAMFEDNYPLTQGDCYSLKKAFYNERDHSILSQVIKTYYEFPPVFKLSHTRWKDEWIEPDYPTPQPLLQEVFEDYEKVYLDEAPDYTWICYIEMK